jgi:hypothetical protein
MDPRVGPYWFHAGDNISQTPLPYPNTPSYQPPTSAYPYQETSLPTFPPGKATAHRTIVVLPTRRDPLRRARTANRRSRAAHCTIVICAPNPSRSAPTRSHRQPPQSSCTTHHRRAPNPLRSASTCSHRQPPQSSCPSHHRRALNPSRCPSHHRRAPYLSRSTLTRLHRQLESSCQSHHRRALTLNLTQTPSLTLTLKHLPLTLLHSHRLHRVLYLLDMTRHLHRVPRPLHRVLPSSGPSIARG